MALTTENVLNLHVWKFIEIVFFMSNQSPGISWDAQKEDLIGSY